MTSSFKIIASLSLMLLSVIKTLGQPVWVPGTPSVSAVGPTSITVNYGIDSRGTVYIIVFNSERKHDLVKYRLLSKNASTMPPIINLGLKQSIKLNYTNIKKSYIFIIKSNVANRKSILHQDSKSF